MYSCIKYTYILVGIITTGPTEIFISTFLIYILLLYLDDKKWITETNYNDKLVPIYCFCLNIDMSFHLNIVCFFYVYGLTNELEVKNLFLWRKIIFASFCFLFQIFRRLKV